MSSFMPPSTPPRKGRKQIKSPLSLKTPQTSSLKKVKDFFANTNNINPTNNSNHINGKTPKSRGFGNSLMPVTPDFTPQKSPRIIRKKRSNIEDMFRNDTITMNNINNINGNNGNNNFEGIFLPTPSTVGTGRKLAPGSTKPQKVSLTMDALSKLNDSLNFESDDEQDQDDKDDDDINFFLKTPSRGNKNLQFNPMLLDSPTTTFDIPSSPTKLVPQTPLRQLIDDNKINDWHGKSKAYFLDDDEILEDGLLPKELTLKKLVNPFLSDSTNINKIKSNDNNNNNNNLKKNLKFNEVDYSTHVEFIHNKTGERKVVKLLDRQANIKPKKLDFSSAI